MSPSGASQESEVRVFLHCDKLFILNTLTRDNNNYRFFEHDLFWSNIFACGVVYRVHLCPGLNASIV